MICDSENLRIYSKDGVHGEKGIKSPAYTPKDPAKAMQRRAAFYPYEKTIHTIEIRVSVQHKDIDKLTPEDITLEFGPTELNEKIETWKDVYGIEERYKAKLCGKNDGKYWYMQVHDEC